jgi:hypothetical protein
VSHSEGVFRKILAWDVIGLCAHLAVVVTDDYKFKDLIAQRGPGAQSLLGLLQTVCLGIPSPVCTIDANSIPALRLHYRSDLQTSPCQSHEEIIQGLWTKAQPCAYRIGTGTSRTGWLWRRIQRPNEWQKAGSESLANLPRFGFNQAFEGIAYHFKAPSALA